jgi:hypothetical protein
MTFNIYWFLFYCGTYNCTPVQKAIIVLLSWRCVCKNIQILKKEEKNKNKRKKKKEGEENVFGK